MKIFFAGPLTNLANPDKTKRFYRKLAHVATLNGFEYFWAFLRGTDPTKNPDVPPSQVYKIDTYHLKRADFMVAYMGEPSTGTGIEIEYANTNRIPVYIMYEKGKHVSRMLRGCPAVKKEIVFKSKRDALAQFDTFLKQLHLKK